MLKDHKALELDKILLQLANETTCPDAAELAQKIEPDTDIRHVERLLQETDDAFVLMAKYGAPSFYGIIVCCRDIACHPQCFGLA